MKLFISYAKDSFRNEFVRMVFNFDKRGRVNSSEDYYLGDLQYLIKSKYEDTTNVLLSTILVPTSNLDHIRTNYKFDRMKILLDRTPYGILDKYSFKLNNYGLYESIDNYSVTHVKTMINWVPRTKSKTLVQKLRFEYSYF